MRESTVNEESFNMGLRKYLKKVGVTSQREIEQCVDYALESGKLSGNEKLKARVTLEIEELGLRHTIDGVIPLE